MLPLRVCDRRGAQGRERARRQPEQIWQHLECLISLSRVVMRQSRPMLSSAAVRFERS
jgi:hypothetical protein